VNPVAIRAVANFLLAPTLVVAVAVLVKGYADTGDGFAAGAIAALAIVVQYAAHGAAAVREAFPVRWAPRVAVAGLVVALADALQAPVRGEPLLTHEPAPGTEALKVGTLELVTAVVFDVGVFLLVLGAVVAIIDALAGALDGVGVEA
jgi:multisubunit Na+/H+ antiporter MnhB subunit